MSYDGDSYDPWTQMKSTRAVAEGIHENGSDEKHKIASYHLA